MLTILIRTVLLYAILIITMRFMGKRQLGELEITDLATALLISEIASLPLTNTDIPLSHAILPVLVLMSLEVLLSGALLKLPLLKGIFSAHPAILVRHGIPDRKAMLTARISAEELLSQLRQKDVSDLDELEYAILEPNGQISIIKKAPERQPTAQELGIQLEENGLAHPVICDGKINRKNLELAGKDEAWLTDYLEKKKIRRESVFLLLVDDSGRVRIHSKKGGDS
ncbi:MAG: DUF421 domain-containing protein [Clostridia bacterium]|nr:DUF421 domain-containing protein [Clostridia bacterium]